MNKKILIACEESQAICIAFRKLGFEAYSCDILPCSGGHPEWHIEGDVLPILEQDWDLIIAHPPCTHLSSSGAAWFAQKRLDGRQQEGIDFFMKFTDLKCPMVAIENPIGIMSTNYRKPDQIIQPYQFGEPFTKSTCLWLKGLPKLQPTNILEKPESGWKNQSFTPDGRYGGFNGKFNGSLERSKTFQGIADAIAEQWGDALMKYVKPKETPRILTKVLVGSRLHGTATDTSDYDYRGIHVSSLKSTLSPFRKANNTSWIEGDEDNTSYELAEFCKLAVHGNATILEVFFSNKIIETTPIIDEMRANWIKFMDVHKFILASRGYAHNQWNKFYNFESAGVNGQERTAKFAIAFLRVMWQCEQFLLTGEFKCNLESSDIFTLIKKIKRLSVDEIQPFLPEIVAAMSDMNMRVSVAESKSKYLDIKPDIEWIEDFILRAYKENKDEI